MSDNIQLSKLSDKKSSLVKQKSILSSHKHTAPNLLSVIYNGQDLTPKPISACLYKSGKERQLNIFDIQLSGSVNRSTSKVFKSESENVWKIQTDLGGGAGITKTHDTLYMTFEQTDLFDSDEGSVASERPSPAASRFSEISQPYERPPEKMPAYVSLVLRETETQFIFSLPSCTVIKDSTEGEVVEEQNRQYEYMTVGKGRNRKVVNAEVQSVPILSKSRETEAPMPKRINHHSFASLWDMFDTFLEAEKREKGLKEKERMTSLVSMDSLALQSEEKQMLHILHTDNFQESLCIMQRILANNVFNEQQKRFRGLSDPSPFRENIEFDYRLNYLWTFSNEETKGRCVSAMCWNTKNKDILAVGYGKFYYDDETTGMVLIWNIKNPVQPEREYFFQPPVTALSFSVQNPYQLAVGFYNGDVKVVDISIRKLELCGLANKQTCQLFEPVWQLAWFTDLDYYKGQEFLVATTQDGRVCKFRIITTSLEMDYIQIMKVSNAEGKLKGIETLRKCPTKVIPLSRHSAALVYTPHPIDPNLYFIGTAEGVVHKCSKNYYHQHLDLFLAHESPMYSIEFSPFCNRLFLTCGDDWAIRLWVDEISEPLFDIKKRMMGVQGVAWSPSHSTIIASISGNEIFLWDLQRKTYDSQSATVSPTKSRNTLLKFTDDGRCLLVADIDGNVHVFSLEDMPFVAFFQENLLTQSIKRALITRPDLLNRFDKLGSLSFNAAQYDRYK